MNANESRDDRLHGSSSSTSFICIERVRRFEKKIRNGRSEQNGNAFSSFFERLSSLSVSWFPMASFSRRRRQRPSRFGNRQKLRARQSSELKKFDGVTFIEVEMHRIRTHRKQNSKYSETKTRNVVLFRINGRTDGQLVDQRQLKAAGRRRKANGIIKDDSFRPALKKRKWNQSGRSE